MFIVLFGIQGSGKGTQGELLQQYFGHPHLSAGDVLRELAKQDTEDGRHVRDTMARGDLLSDADVTRFLRDYLPAECFLDGYPRSVGQAQALDSIKNIDWVIFIDLHEPEAKRRALARGRADDTPEAIHRRIQNYHAHADSILDYYKAQNKLIVIDGDKPIPQVFSAVVTALQEKGVVPQKTVL